jgi:hypothetical protein
MLITTDYIEPSVLTGYARAALDDLEVNQFTLSRFLPSRTLDDLSYRLAAGGQGLTDAATFRSYDTPAPIGGRPPLSDITGDLPPLSRKVRLGEYDKLRLRGNTNAVVNAVYADATRMARAIAARVELARADALVNGTVTIAENNLQITVNFQRNPGNTVLAAPLWGGVNPTPLTNLVAWHGAYLANSGGFEPGAIVTSTQVIRTLQQSAEVINAITGAAAGRTRVTQAELNGLLESEGLPRLEANDAQVSVNGAAARLIPANRLLMLPAAGPFRDPDGSVLGGTLWGITAEAQEPEYDLAGSEAGIVAGSYGTKDPVALWTKAAAIALPVLANPDLSLSATVL